MWISNPDTGAIVEPKIMQKARQVEQDATIMACPHGGAKAFLVPEITIIEIEGIEAGREPDEKTGLNLLKPT